MKAIVIGGHLSPALAVIEALPKNCEVLYVGRKHALEGDEALALEYQSVKKLGINFVNLSTGRLQRKFTPRTLWSLGKIPDGFWQALKSVRSFKPDVIVGFGGYLQVPVCIAGYLNRVPIVIHEQTIKAGLANKAIAPFASVICVSWSKSKEYFPKNKTILTGLPLRKKFIELREKALQGKNKDKRKILITGGSLGAHAINVLIEKIVEKLLDKFEVTHQTGDARQYMDFERLGHRRAKMAKRLQDNYKLVKFIDVEKMPDEMNKADLTISRSGANTTAELIFLRKRAILVPLPFAQQDEQKENAMVLERLGLGVVLEQEQLTGEMLYSQIIDFADKLKKQEKINIGYENFEEKGAKKIAEIIKQQAGKKNHPKKP